MVAEIGHTSNVGLYLTVNYVMAIYI